MNQKKEIMDRRAADNKYLHRDFHVSMKMALDYCHARYGGEGVRQYLRQFSAAYFRPLAERMRAEGLEPLRTYFERIYEAEEARVETELTDRTLTVRVPRCPAVACLRGAGQEIPPYYEYTATVVYEELCRGTGIRFLLDEYDPETGRCAMRFVREGEPA